MKIYLASRYSRRVELCAYRADLEHSGHHVTSRWLNGAHQIADMRVGDQGAEAPHDDRIRFAQEDWDDLMAAECCISFTEPSRTGPTRGGRHVEFGAAMAVGKRCIVVGHHENVFHCLPNVEFYALWPEAFAAVTGGRCLAA